MPHPHRIEEDGLPVLVVRLEQREVAHVREDRDDQPAHPAREPEVRTQCEGGAEARGGVGREGHMPASGEEKGGNQSHSVALKRTQSHSSRRCWPSIGLNSP